MAVPVGSPEWIAAADAAARADEDLRAAARGRHVVLGQEIRAPDGDVRWHLALDDGEVAVRAGWPDALDVTLSQDRDVAEAIARGDLAARTAFVMGRIRLGGDPAHLIDLGPALAGLGDVFAPIRDLGPSAPDVTAPTRTPAPDLDAPGRDVAAPTRDLDEAG